MGVRFRKSKQLMPGVRLNVGKRGVGLSFGGKGLRYSVNTSGRKTTTVGIPGSGLSYSHTTNSKSKSKAKASGRAKVQSSRPELQMDTRVTYADGTQTVNGKPTQKIQTRRSAQVKAGVSWLFAVMFGASGISFFGDRNAGAGIVGLVIAAALGFWGYKKFKKSKDLPVTAAPSYIPQPESGNTTSRVDTTNMSPEQAINAKYQAAKESGNVMDLHYALNNLVEHYYSNRDNPPVNGDLCIKYCQEDIDLFPQLHPLFMADPGFIPRLPAYQRLAMIYDQRGEYQKAISVCDIGLKYGLADGTQGGFQARKERLEKKLKEQQPAEVPVEE